MGLAKRRKYGSYETHGKTQIQYMYHAGRLPPTQGRLPPTQGRLPPTQTQNKPTVTCFIKTKTPPTSVLVFTLLLYIQFLLVPRETAIYMYIYNNLSASLFTTI